MDVHHEQLAELVQRLQKNELRSELADELQSIQAILGEDSLHPKYQLDTNNQPHSIQLTIHLTINQSTPVQLLIILPDHYPKLNSSPPQVHLISKYLDNIKVHPQLIQDVHHTTHLFLHHNHQLLLLYDIILNAKEIIQKFYLENQSINHQDSNSLLNQQQKYHHDHIKLYSSSSSDLLPLDKSNSSIESNHKKLVFHSSLPIVDRKSTFIGHSISLVDPNQVPFIIQELLDDKKISKASHNIVAWRCEFNGSLHQDCDDDGESAAGSRMLHLLSILNVKNVFVCVSRWFGGIHLGPDRFKHINQATRDALIVGGFISPTHTTTSSSSSGNHNNQSKKSFSSKKKK